MDIFQTSDRGSCFGANPFSATVTASSSQIVSANTKNRYGTLLIFNTGASTVYLALGQAAVAGAGIPLVAGAGIGISATEFLGPVFAISPSGSTVAISEGGR